MSTIISFLSKNWVNLGLVIVGSFAMVIYGLQEHKKKIEAASLVKIQIDELEERLREISTYIVEKEINESAFYESLPLMEENYWNKYKHYFVRKMDHKSFSDINLLYSYASEIQEQQLLLKQIQKDSFSLTQKVLLNIEMQLIFYGINNQYGVSPQQIATQNFNFDMQQFWTNYNQKKQQLELIINQKALTSYAPVQVRISIEKKLQEYSMLNVSGSLGYQILCKFAKRRL